MKKNVFLLTSFALLNLFVLGQNPFNLNNVPAAPNNAALFKVEDVPVSLSSGTMNLNIPVYSYSKNNLNLNVSIDHQTQGIRVEEIASNVGLGWSLNAGGVIIRQMRGLPDDIPGQGYLSLGNNQDPTGVENYYAENGRDGEQDVYNLSFPGGGCKFLIKTSGEAVVLSQRKLKITVQYGYTGVHTNISGFSVTDENGIKYTFNVLEKTTTYLGQWVTPGFMYVSAWYLSKIENVFTNEAILFEYEVSNVKYKTRNSQVFRHKLQLITVPNGAIGTPIDAAFGPNLNYPYNEDKEVTTTGARIKLIKLPDNSKVRFDYSGQKRADVGNDFALNRIVLLDKNDLVIKGKRFIQNYIDHNGQVYSSSAVTPNEYYGETNLRMRLTEVKELGANMVEGAGYTLQYNDTYFLPDRFSAKQDHWGYYNGEKNNGSDVLVPKAVYANSLGYQLLEGADRIPEPVYTKASSLKKIIYPTGGYKEFEYETNKAGDGKLIDTTLIQNNILIGNPEGQTNTMQYFTINRIENNAPLQFRARMFSTGLPTNNTCAINVEIRTSDLSTLITSFSFYAEEINTDKYAQVNSLPNGNYVAVWSFSPTQCAEISQAFIMRIYWKQIIINNEQLAGGLRIKKVTTSDGSTSPPIVKEYRYITETGASSGVVFRQPRYTSVLTEVHDVDQSGGSSNILLITHSGRDASSIWDWILQSSLTVNLSVKGINYLTRASASNYPLAYSVGKNIMYTRVEVIEGNAENNMNLGKEVYHFRTYKNIISTELFYATPPFVEPQIKDWELGLVLKKETFDKQGNIKEIEENTYNIESAPVDTEKNLKVGRTSKNYSSGSNANNIYNKYIIENYFWQVGKSELTKTIKTSFTDPIKSIVNITDYIYDPVYFNLKKQTITNSLGYKIEKRVYYPYDYSAGPVLQDMVNANIITKPVSNEVWKINGTAASLLSADAFEYKNVSGQFLPWKYHKLVTAIPIEKSVIGEFNSGTLLRDPSKYTTEIVFDEYDTRGNILQIDAKGLKKSYIWGSLFTDPVSEIINAYGNETFHDNFEDLSGWDGSMTAYDKNKRRTGSYSGRIDKPGSGELYSHSTKWLNISLTAAKRFKYSVWVYSDGPSAELFLFMRRANDPAGSYSSFDRVETSVTNKWTLIEKEVEVPSDVVQLNLRVDNNGGGKVWFDDVRLHPADAMMTTYTYKPLVGMSSQTDVNNRSVFYEYDAFNRLNIVRDQDGKIIKKICYNYAGQAEECNVFYNAVKTGNFTKANCSGGTGSTVTYTVAEGVYSASSQTAADALAQNDVDANGQAYANQHGTCIFSSSSYSGTYYSTACSGEAVPEPIYVNVPAGMFTSSVSLQDANNQALAYAQNYANTYGTCATNVNLYGQNDVGDDVYIILTNTSTYQQYFLYMSPFAWYGQIGTVPPGNYDVEMGPSGFGYINYSAGCSNFSSGYNAFFYNITINSSCNTFNFY